MLLGIDTSAGLTVAVAGDGGGAERLDARPTVHAEQLSGLIEATCADAGITVRELTGVVVGTGPAPFTGLRVGLMTARTLADALGIEVRGVCSLDVLALQVLADAATDPAAALAEPTAKPAEPTATPAADPGGEFLVVTDARRREVYWARYSAAAAVRIDGPDVVAPGALAAEVEVFGAGTALYPDVFGGPRPPFAVSAAAMLRGVAEGLLEVTAPEPRYLRRPDVSLPA